VSEHAPVFAARLRHALFVLCVACTLWLVVQNAILLALLPVALSAGLLHAGVASSPLTLAWALSWALIPVAFALGWFASRGPRPARTSDTARAHDQEGRRG
jgi:hypothetical protein